MNRTDSDGPDELDGPYDPDEPNDLNGPTT